MCIRDSKTITYTIAAGTATLADHGTFSIPVIISGATYTLSFALSLIHIS